MCCERTVSRESASRASATASAAHTASYGVARSVDSSRCSHGDADCSDCTIRLAAEAGGDEAAEDDDDDADADDEDEADEDENEEAVAEDADADEVATVSGGGTGSI